MPAQSPSFIARGDVEPSVFVKQDGATDNGIVQSVADDESIGISHEGTREAPVEGITPLAAKDGESCMVYTDGWTCEVIAAGVIAPGAKLKPNADGHAIATTTAGDVYSAIARSAGAAGTRCKVIVRRGIVETP